MADHYCPFCGAGHGGESDSEPAETVVIDNTVTSAEVEIARINADRDIKLARINAGVIDQERDEDLARAEGRAEGMADALETIAPDPEPAPIIVDAPEVESEPVEPMSPPPVSDSSPSEPAKPKRPSHGMSSAWFG